MPVDVRRLFALFRRHCSGSGVVNPKRSVFVQNQRSKAASETTEKLYPDVPRASCATVKGHHDML
ncbi:hypothetical protein YQE_05236, partial [Dendroctonus ponderosae]